VDYAALVKFVQEHFTDGLVLTIGSGLSCAEGLPGMGALATYLQSASGELVGTDAGLWIEIDSELKKGAGLEAALLAHAPSEALEAWIAKKTASLLIPKELEVMSEAIRGGRRLRLTRLLGVILKPQNGLPILTSNYDRLIELACEMSGYHVDTTATGQYGGGFNAAQSCMASCRSVTTRAKVTVLDHFPRAVVLKPHGSFDWYRSADGPIRCSLPLDADRLIITPGLNKYRAGYASPFDKHRELANDHIQQCARLLIVGYGFNDAHLQTHLEKRIRDGTPTLILNRSLSDKVRELSEKSPRCVCLSKPSASNGIVMITNGSTFENDGPDLWDIGVLAQEILT